MKNQNWTENELRILEEWDWVKRYINTQYPDQVSEIDKMRCLVSEAKLLIANKLIIIYAEGSEIPEEIVSFREYVAKIDKNEQQFYQLSFHPINFKSLVEYRRYINHVREEFFALLN